MFIDPGISGEQRGWIEVICGSMFSGKTEELIRRIKRAKIANRNVLVFKPAVDTRYHETKVISHDTNALPSTSVKSSSDILLTGLQADIVGIDEAQFFDAEIIFVCETLALNGVRVIVAGLDMDYLGKPFGYIPHLLAIADYTTKLHAICVKCGNLASISFRKTADNQQILLGEKDIYEPRCRKCCQEG